MLTGRWPLNVCIGTFLKQASAILPPRRDKIRQWANSHLQSNRRAHACAITPTVSTDVPHVSQQSLLLSSQLCGVRRLLFDKLLPNAPRQLLLRAVLLGLVVVESRCLFVAHKVVKTLTIAISSNIEELRILFLASGQPRARDATSRHEAPQPLLQGVLFCDLWVLTVLAIAPSAISQRAEEISWVEAALTEPAVQCHDPLEDAIISANLGTCT
mmetsp:Transcript_103242/g.287357  ORF Transcript_103242/g.287357 Transcript_103242/m.287357 type:complete len:214 (-) Transcript_103242:4-645(-)